jgi:hypothetical protein
MSEVTLNGTTVSVAAIANPAWEWPADGIMVVKYIYFTDKKPMPMPNYKALREEVRRRGRCCGSDGSRSHHSLCCDACGAV